MIDDKTRIQKIEKEVKNILKRMNHLEREERWFIIGKNTINKKE